MAEVSDILRFFAGMVPLGLGRTPPALADHAPDAGKMALAGIWANILGDMTGEELMQAQAAYLRSPAGKWWPTPAEIREHAPSVARARLAETPRDLWPAVLRACGSATPGADLRRYVDSYAGGISDGEWAQVQRECARQLQLPPLAVTPQPAPAPALRLCGRNSPPHAAGCVHGCLQRLLLPRQPAAPALRQCVRQWQPDAVAFCRWHWQRPPLPPH